MSYFPPYGHNKNKSKVELYLINYTTKCDFKIVTGVDTSQFAERNDFANLKSEIHKLNIDELKYVPSGLNSLKSKVHRLDVNKLMSVRADLKELSGVVNKDVFCYRLWCKDQRH